MKTIGSAIAKPLPVTQRASFAASAQAMRKATAARDGGA
jgi:hypothetical protein